MTTRLTVLLATLALVAPACGDDDNDSKTTDVTTGTDATSTSDADTAGAECDPVAQTGCAAAMNCSYSNGVPRCFDEGAVAYEAPCDQENPCERGACLSINETAQLCYRYCDPDANTCPDDARCIALSSSPFGVCEIEGIYTECDLLSQACDAGKACYSVLDRETPICLPEGDTATGQPCTSASACVGGDVCLNQECHRICDPEADPDPCGALGTCQARDGFAGFCQAPAE